MTQAIDRNLLHRVKDVGDALAGRLEQRRLNAVVSRLIAAADHLGSAAVGSRLAVLLTEPAPLELLMTTFGQGTRALDMAALTLAPVGVHSAIDQCAGAIMSVVDTPPRPGQREPGIPGLVRRAERDPLPPPFQRWLDETLEGDRYGQLELWRDPQVHRPVPRVAFAGPETDEGLSRGSVRVYRSYELNGRELEELLGVAADVLPRLLEYGEERFLALCGTLRATYAPDWRRP